MVVVVLDALSSGTRQNPRLFITIAGLILAAAINRAGKPSWAARTAILTILLTAILLVFEAHDGIRSHAMLFFPGLLLVSVMLLDRASYLITSGVILLAVVFLGIAERHGLTAAIPGVRTPTSRADIIYIDLNLMVFALIGSRIARDAQRNVFDLRTGVDRLSAANAELVRTKEDLQDSEYRLISAQGLTHVGSWHWNLGTHRVVCSEECRRIFGQPDDWTPSPEGLLEIIAPSERARVANEIQRSIANKAGLSTEFQVIRPNGELRTVTFASQIVLDEAGSPQHIFGACQDVTEARRMQEEAFARQKLETVGILANGIAHDFNNLLGGVLSQAELALSNLADGSDPREELEAICEVAKRGSEIVGQLMIYAGQEPDSPELVNVAQIVEDMAGLLDVSISKPATLRIDLDKAVPEVRASAAQIRQIVMNLVINASESIGDREGVVHLTVRRAAAGRELFGGVGSHAVGGDCVIVEVADTGVGIAPEIQAHIFDPFFSTKPLGHGLGLAAVSGIIRDLAGSIQFVSEPGKGTTFQVRLRVEQSTAKAVACADSPAEPAREDPAATVLVVEDEAVLRGAAAKMLRKGGVSVLEAGDGTTAIAAMQGNRRIDLLLLDVTLPGTPSREVLAEARRIRPGMRVIVTSAYGRDVATESLQADFEQFVRKPYSVSDLVRLVQQLILNRQ